MNNKEIIERIVWDAVQAITQVQKMIENEQKVQLEVNHDTQQ